LDHHVHAGNFRGHHRVFLVRVIQARSTHMPAFTQHIFVCGNQRQPGHPRGCCDPTGANALRNALKAAVKSRDLGPTVRVNSAGCLDQCECGPTVVVYPEAIWYGNVQLDDVPRIVEETVCNGLVLEDLLIPNAMLNTKGRGPNPADAAS
jgi:(2Fe-2S) ferredoxin